MQVRPTMARYFGEDALEWFDRAYVVDWIVVSAIWVLSQVAAWSPVFERDFNVSDPLISFPHKKNQVSSTANHLIALFGPLLLFVAIGSFQGSLCLIHNAAVGLCAARGLARLVTGIIKHSVGRLRPDFMDRCQWDATIMECAGPADKINDGRKSFPSGHSSTAFSGMFFVSLFIAGQTAAWCFSVPKHPRTLRSSRMLCFVLTLLPLFWALRVAISRIQDNRHHKEDVVVGSLIGIASALICYLIFWPSPFSPSSFDIHLHGQPRPLYLQGEYHRTHPTDFELSYQVADEEHGPR